MTMQFLAVERHIVHATASVMPSRRYSLGIVAMSARRGRHVQALVGSDEVAVVDLTSCARLVVEGRSGGAVGLIAHDQVRRAQPDADAGLR